MSGKKRKKSVLRKGLSSVFFTVALGFGVVTQVGEPLQAHDAVDGVTQPAVFEQDVYVSPTAGITHRSRGLTTGEEKLARSLFDTALDVSDMRFQFYPNENPEASAMIQATETKNVEFYGHRYLPADFSREAGAPGSTAYYNFGNFVSLMTGALQHQQWATWRYNAGAEGYDYTLAKDKSFADFGLVQQMAIMEDYALRFLHPSHTSRRQAEKGQTRETDKLLMATVENRFPAARQTREALWETYARPVTAGEIALAHAILGDKINTQGLRLFMHPEDFSDVAASAPDGRSARFWGADDHSPDYSGDADIRLFGNYVHEILHVWQWQHNWSETPNMDEGEYKYTLDEKKTFRDYSIEQQAALVEDYARYYLHSGRNTYWLQQTYTEAVDQRAKLPLLRQLVETQFPAARNAREAFEAKKLPVAGLSGRSFG